MKTYQTFKTELKEKILHQMFKNIDLKIAKGIHQDLIKNQVIDRDHKFGDVIDKKEIDKYFSHSPDMRSHNYRDEIESYNAIIKRGK